MCDSDASSPLADETAWKELLEKTDAACRSGVFFLEVGAMDGKSFDPLYDSVNRYGWQGLCVEPLPDLFERLVETYQGHDGVAFENVAIAEEPGSRTLYRVPLSAVTDGLVPPWAAGISSFYLDRNGLGGYRVPREDFERIRPLITEEAVRCDTLARVLGRHRVGRIDVLQIDTEGHDYHVLKQFDFARFTPFVIRMEWENLPADEQAAARALLEKHGYRLDEFGTDLVAQSARM